MKYLLLSALTFATTALAGDYAGETGLQLYSLRDSFKADVPGSLDKVKSFGIKSVETAGTYGMPAVDFRKLLDERGLKAVSGHFAYDRYEKELPKVAEEAKALGLEYLGIAWIPHVPALFGMDTTEKAAEDFNKWGEELSKQGLKFFYHCHGYEFKAIAEGSDKTYMDVLMEKTDPKFVSFEMDVFWVVMPGADPAKYLAKYPGRWALMHLKDLQKGVPTGSFTGHTDVKQNVVIGTGQIPWAPLLKAAAASGVKRYFIEDESPTSEAQIPESVKYLETLK